LANRQDFNAHSFPDYRQEDIRSRRLKWAGFISGLSTTAGNDMQNVKKQLGIARTWGFAVLVAAISLAACVSNYSYTQVSPSEAVSVLHPGDAVEITRKNDSVVYLRIKEIDDTEVLGSDQTSMFGRIKKTIPLDDIASISLSRKEGYDSEQTIEAWSYLLILWPFFVF
jgi:hypothetical protein